MRKRASRAKPMEGRTARGMRPWTPERVALLGELVKAGVGATDSVPQLNELPGPPITKGTQVRAKMAALGLKLSPEHRHAVFTKTLKYRANPSGGAPRRMTGEREALLREMVANRVPYPEMCSRLNELPGLPIRGDDGVRWHIRKLALIPARPRLTDDEKRLRKLARRRVLMAEKRAAKAQAPIMRTRARIAPPPAKPAPEPIVIVQHYTLADAAVNRKQEAARAALAKRNADPFDIARRIGMPPREVLRIQGEMRRGVYS